MKSTERLIKEIGINPNPTGKNSRQWQELGRRGFVWCMEQDDPHPYKSGEDCCPSCGSSWGVFEEPPQPTLVNAAGTESSPQDRYIRKAYMISSGATSIRKVIIDKYDYVFCKGIGGWSSMSGLKAGGHVFKILPNQVRCTNWKFSEWYEANWRLDDWAWVNMYPKSKFRRRSAPI